MMQAAEITQEEFVTAHQQGAQVVNVRSSQEYVAGHVPGTVNVPLDELGAGRAELGTGPVLHVICQGGGRSMKTSELLATGGFRRCRWPAGRRAGSAPVAPE